MLVLGLNIDGHEPAAALVADGELLTMARQERFSRRRHGQESAPIEAVDWCLAQAEIRPCDVDAIAIGSDCTLLPNTPNQAAPPDVYTALPQAFAALSDRPLVHSVAPFLAHAASAFYPSGFTRAAVIVGGARGDCDAVSIGVADGTGIRLLDRLPDHRRTGVEGVGAALVRAATRARELTGLAHLVLAGPLATDSTANGFLVDSGLFEAYFIPPVAGDEGTAMGAALEVVHAECRRWRRPVDRTPMTHAYWGPEYGDIDYRAALRAAGVTATRYGDDALAKVVAHALVEGHIVAYFDGPAEVGPCALGARGLLADPRNRAAAARVNHLSQQVSWLPAGSSLLADDAEEYLVGQHASPFRNVARRVRAEFRDRVPAVVDVDGMTDVQLVRLADAPRLHALISEFRRQTGIPMVVSASWRGEGGPGVENPAEAIDRFRATDIGLLVLGNNVVSRTDQAG